MKLHPIVESVAKCLQPKQGRLVFSDAGLLAARHRLTGLDREAAREAMMSLVVFARFLDEQRHEKAAAKALIEVVEAAVGPYLEEVSVSEPSEPSLASRLVGPKFARFLRSFAGSKADKPELKLVIPRNIRG